MTLTVTGFNKPMKRIPKGPVKKVPWTCGCDRSQPYYLVRCPRCGKGRP